MGESTPPTQTLLSKFWAGGRCLVGCRPKLTNAADARSETENVSEREHNRSIGLVVYIFAARLLDKQATSGKRPD